MTNAPGLVKKLAAIMKDVGWVEKKGRNEFHKYDYVTEADIVEAVRKKLADAGIVSIPQLDSINTEKLEKGVLATITVSYAFTDGTESVSVRVAGMGYDTPGDKAVYKAMTGAEKYAIKQLFLIPTGDDPERDSAEPASAAPARVPNVSQDAPRSAQRAPGGPPVIKFGPGKGKALTEATEQELATWTTKMEQAIAQNDPKWHAANVHRLGECQAEWERRSPWRKLWKEVLKDGEANGLDEVGVKAILEGMNIKAADKLTSADVTKFREKLTELMNEET